MKLIIGSGKTIKLIKECAERDGCIICKTMDTARDIAMVADKIEVNIRFPLSYSEFQQRNYISKNINCFLIDDLEQFLNFISPIHIEVATLRNNEIFTREKSSNSL